MTDSRDLAGRSFDVLVALAVLVVTSPLLLAVSLLILVVDGAPILYRGERLGRHAKPFTIFKFRTLKADAERQVGGDVLGNRHHLKTRTGNFLRETRLDELPQLLNVLRGDMTLVGPRPERREVYGRLCAAIPGYSRRFAVRPGVFGYSQVFTPHSTPKRVRAWIDNRFLARGAGPLQTLGLLFITCAALAHEIGSRVLRFLSQSVLQQAILRRYRERRKTARVSTIGTVAHLGEAADTRQDVEVLDLNEYAFRARFEQMADLREGSRITLRIRDRVDQRVRRARVVVQKGTIRHEGGQYEAIVHYAPWSANSSYVIEQYLLDRSVARIPRRARTRRELVRA